MGEESHQPSRLRAIDLFAGVGGIRLGFEQAMPKLETVFVSEFDPYAVRTYSANFSTPSSGISGNHEPMHENPFVYGDITKIDEHDIPSFDICLAGFPCVAFSQAGRKMGFSDDYYGQTRGTLFRDVVRICRYHQPEVIFCENVKNLVHHDHGKTYKVIDGAFREAGYKTFHKVLNSKDFGIAQNRERIYLVCFREDISPDGFDFPEGQGQDTCISDILDSSPIPAKYYLSDTYLDFCRRHRARHEAKGNGFGYVIRDLDGIAGTLVTGGMGRERNLIIDHRPHSMVPTTSIKGNINDEDVRKMTPREWARLQGFPDDFVLVGSDTRLYKQMGNSVSVPVIKAIASEIAKVLGIA